MEQVGAIMADNRNIRHLIWAVHQAQWLPGKRCLLSAHVWEQLAEAEQRYLVGLARLSSIDIVLEEGMHGVE